MAELVFERYEKKYLLDEEQYKALSRAIDGFTVPDEYGEYTICSLYYDTPDDRLIRQSIEKPVYKEKLRLRSYGVPDYDSGVFLEIKKKYDGVVYKRREKIRCGDIAELIGNGSLPQYKSQIFRELSCFISFYRPVPKVFIAYDRRALCGKEDRELRITFDRNIRFRTESLDLTCGDYGEQLLDSGMHLMEIKAHGAMPMWLVKILSGLEIYPTSFSKYGSIYTRLHSPQSRITLSSSEKTAVNL